MYEATGDGGVVFNGHWGVGYKFQRPDLAAATARLLNELVALDTVPPMVALKDGEVIAVAGGVEVRDYDSAHERDGFADGADDWGAYRNIVSRPGASDGPEQLYIANVIGENLIDRDLPVERAKQTGEQIPVGNEGVIVLYGDQETGVTALVAAMGADDAYDLFLRTWGDDIHVDDLQLACDPYAEGDPA